MGQNFAGPSGMNATVLGILGTVLVGFLTFVAQWLKQSQDQRTGAELEAGKVSASTAKTEGDMLQASANAPTTKDQLVAAAEKGQL